MKKVTGVYTMEDAKNTTDLQLSILQDQDPSNYYSFREDKNANTRRSANVSASRN